MFTDVAEFARTIHVKEEPAEAAGAAAADARGGKQQDAAAAAAAALKQEPKEEAEEEEANYGLGEDAMDTDEAPGAPWGGGRLGVGGQGWACACLAAELLPLCEAGAAHLASSPADTPAPRRPHHTTLARCLQARPGTTLGRAGCLPRRAARAAPPPLRRSSSRSCAPSRRRGSARRRRRRASGWRRRAAFGRKPLARVGGWLGVQVAGWLGGGRMARWRPAADPPL